MTETGPERRSRSDIARDRATVKDVVPGIVALIVVQASLEISDPKAGASGWNLVWSLLPLAPVAWLVWTEIRLLRRADEYQRTVQLEALAIGFATVMVVALAGGLLDAAGVGDPRQSLQITFTAGVLGWLIALAVGTVRSR